MRKIKNGAKKPPLSLLDMTIYVFIIFSGASLGIAVFYFLGFLFPRSIAFADDTVVASSGIAALICAIPLSLMTFFIIAVASGEGVNNKQPIFGNKRFKPSRLTPVIKTYPLFSKEFKKNLSSSTKRDIRKTIKICIIIFMICSLIYIPSICPRTVLDKNNNFTTYNVFNKATHNCTITDAENLIIDIYHNINYRSDDTWGIQLEFSCADKTHQFNLGSFYEMNIEETLNYMLYLKSLMSDRYEITNIDRMGKLIWDRGFSEKETQLVYELFDYEVA